jgi:hypothetical protein
MGRLPLSAALFCLGTASAVADIVDVRALGDGRAPDVFIDFAQTPNLLESRLDGQVIELELSGVDVRARRIEPADNAWITAIETQPSDDREIVRLVLSERALNMNIERTQSGLRLTWTAVAGDRQPDVRGPTMTERPDSAPEEMALATDSGETIAEASAAAEPVADPDTVTPAPAEMADAADAADCAGAAAALETDSWNIDALTVQAGCLIEEGDTARAIPMLERVVAFEPGRFDAVIALAEAREALGEIAQAQALYEQAADIAATDGQAVAARARARRLAQSPDS